MDEIGVENLNNVPREKIEIRNVVHTEPFVALFTKACYIKSFFVRKSTTTYNLFHVSKCFLLSERETRRICDKARQHFKL